jgi:tetratricopeptide (TPR) repeat protein
MIIIRRSFVSRAFLALAAFAFLSCATPGGGTGTPDERAMERGVEAWNKKGPEAARGHWSEIKDAKAKKRYLGYIESFDQGEETISSALESSKQDEPSLLAASERALASFSSLDERLVLPQAVRKDGLTLTEGRVKALLASGKSEKALDMAKKAERHYGQSDRLTALTKEADIAASSRKRAALARANAETLRARGLRQEDLGFEQALAAYAKAEESLASDAKAAGLNPGRYRRRTEKPQAREAGP